VVSALELAQTKAKGQKKHATGKRPKKIRKVDEIPSGNKS